MRRENNVKIISFVIAICFIGMIAYSLLPPAAALELEPGSVLDTSVTVNEDVRFKEVNITIKDFESVPGIVANFTIHQSSGGSVVDYFTFTLNASEISDPSSCFTITEHTTIQDDWYNYGYGYVEFDGTPYEDFGYGYGYGYGDASQTDITVLYNITYKATHEGTFYAKLAVTATNDGDTYNHTFTSEASSSFTVSSGGGGGGGGVPSSPPHANANGPYYGIVGDVITFDGSGSVALGGAILTDYIWDFGDGSTGTGINPTHSYSEAGNYTVKLTVWDNRDATGWDATKATINAKDISPSPAALAELELRHGIVLTEPFYATDATGSGQIDTFVDPNGIIEMIRYTCPDGQDGFLLSVYGRMDELFFWNVETGVIVDPVEYGTGTITNTSGGDGSLINVTVSVNKSEWIYFSTPDEHTNINTLHVFTSDWREIDSSMVWRDSGNVYVLDDPDTTYYLIYTPGGILFDVEITLPETTIKTGTNLSAIIKLTNVGTVGPVLVTVYYDVLDSSGKIVREEVESTTVNGTYTYTVDIHTSDLAPGSYTLKVTQEYGDSQSAYAEASFKIQSGYDWTLIAVVIIIIIAAIAILLYYLYRTGYIKF